MSTRENKLEAIYALVGRTHRACQLFEYKLAEVLYEWRIHDCPKRPLKPPEAIREISKIQKMTFNHTFLGPNIKELTDKGILKEDIIERLKEFKRQRNDFIHDFHFDYGIELMLIGGNFKKGTFNEEDVEAAYCKLKTVLNQIIYNMEMAADLCKKITDIIQRLG